ncbi:MAG: VCBS repeat-containing protein [Thermoguttaceae bacterium]|nr:VCBS repeat-containing protein [Thermoguttaceae bacterium]
MSRTILKLGVALASLVVVGSAVAVSAQAKEPQFQKIVITDKFRSEGAAFGDFNKDGKMDVVSGHIWYEGPDFKKEHQFMKGEDSYDPEGYSNSFVNFTDDIDGDGWTDIIICPHPGLDGFWYKNPQNKTDGFWEELPSTIQLGNESQAWADVDGDGKNDLIFNRNNWYGFAKPKADGPWDFIAISNESEKYQRYFHGNGYGDLNGDGRVDLFEMDGWREQPEDAKNVPWKFHEFKFADAASNILVYDFNGDGLNDVFTAWHCHLYGLVCYLQKRGADGEIAFDAQWLIPTEPDEAFFPKTSQLHSMALADFNGDGVMDVVSGKRWLAHGSSGDVEPLATPYLFWWETVRGDNGAVSFVPHIIDDKSGVGTQVVAEDINGDNVPDVLVGNKRGCFVFLSK